MNLSLVNLLNFLNMSAYHLRKSEVEYELKVRSILFAGSAAELRKRLSLAIGSNTEVDVAAVNALDVGAEIEECEQKYQDLSTLVSDYEGNYQDNEFHRLVARLWHLYLRADRIPVNATEDEEEGQTKDLLVQKSKELLDSFKDKALEDNSKESNVVKEVFSNPESLKGGGLPKSTRPVKTEEKLPDGLRVQLEGDGKLEGEETKRKVEQHQHKRNLLEQKWLQEEKRIQEEKKEEMEKWKREESQLLREVESVERKSSVLEPKDSGSPCGPQQAIVSGKCIESGNYSRPRYVPVYQWGIKFNNTGPSIASFLERVEELRRARGVSHQELYESAVDLFAGSVLVWYRSVASRINSWHQLTKELREVFQPADYDLRLHQEIFNRTQGDQEPVDLYIAAVEGLFSRLSISVPESTRLAQIYNNLHPQLKDRLALSDIQTLDQLRSLGRRAEAGRLSMTRPRPLPRNETILEPDLAYEDHSRRKGLPAGRVAELRNSSSVERRDVVCWNCRKIGHRFRFCREPKKRFCYGCGKENTFKRECSSCNPKNGAEREVGQS